jgi:hypothetical protein
VIVFQKFEKLRELTPEDEKKLAQAQRNNKTSE